MANAEIPIVKLYRPFVLLAAMLAIGCSPARTDAAAKETKSVAAMLPDRYLTCVLGRSTNIDPDKHQTIADIVSEGHHSLSLRLPPIPAHTDEAPDPSDAPTPVDARTKILADPDGLTKDAAAGFTRVVDLWPTRVEMLSAIAGSTWSQIIILDAIDPASGRAHVFIARIKDAATMDLQKIYQGDCTVRARSSQNNVL